MYTYTQTNRYTATQTHTDRHEYSSLYMRLINRNYNIINNLYFRKRRKDKSPKEGKVDMYETLARTETGQNNEGTSGYTEVQMNRRNNEDEVGEGANRLSVIHDYIEIR